MGPVPRAPRPAPRALGAVLAAVLVVVLALPAGPGAAGPPGPLPTRQATGEEVTFRGLRQTPWVTRDGTWQVELAVEGAPPGSTATAVIYDRFADRQDFARSLFGVVDGARKAGIPPVDLDDAPGGGARLGLAVTLLGADGPTRPGWAFLSAGLAPGVYPVVIEVDDADGQQVGRTVVPLTRVASDDEPAAERPPLAVAPVLGLDAPPSLSPEATPLPPPGLAGRAAALADGLAVAADLPATLAVRPESLEALARDERAQGSLAGLGDAVTGRQVIDRPYVDVATSAWVEHGLDDELRRQRERGNGLLTQLLGQADSGTWLARDGLTGEAVAALWNVGVRTVVLGPATTQPAEGSATGPFTVEAGAGRTVVGVEADGALTDALDRRGDRVRDLADLAAELALVHDASDDGQGVVLLAPEGWPARADDLAALGEVLLDPAAPVSPVTVADLVATVPVGGGRALRPVAPVDLGDHPARLDYARGRLRAYGSMTGPGDAEVASLDQRLLISGARQLGPGQRDAYVDAVVATVEQRLEAVEAPPRQTITLTSRTGEVPLTLRNQLDRAVEVVIELEADSRIELMGDTVLTHTLEPGTNRIAIPVTARVPGDSRMDVTVRTPDGSIALDEVRYTVRSTAISHIGLVLSVGAAGFLALWWVRHWRRARRERAGTDGPPTDPAPT